ncbi:MAG: efflux RND transporter periplasmic adaptor subunit [Bryobacter sp.]
MNQARTVGLFLLLILVGAVLFYAGYAPRQSRLSLMEAEAKTASEERIPVTTTKVKIVSAARQLTLPGNASAIGETPIYARAEGYIVKRYVDMGDRVKAGDVLVEIDSPELDQQVRNSKARLEQLRAATAQVKAAIAQAEANAKLAEVNHHRSVQLVREGVFPKADLDEKTALLDARRADVLAQKANLVAAEEAIRAQLAEVARLEELTSFKKVRAPFAGIITQRNCAVGNLITPAALAAGRDLFRLSDTSRMRIFVSTPQANVGDIRVGQRASVAIPELNKAVEGSIVRTSNALENQTRTLLTEVNVNNPTGLLMPGMFVNVTIETASNRESILVPGDAIVSRSEGLFVAALEQGDQVRFRKIQVGRDFGSVVEATSGVGPEAVLIVNPSDDVKDGVRVRASLRK